jgi:hypothetical protein
MNKLFGLLIIIISIFVLLNVATVNTYHLRTAITEISDHFDTLESQIERISK